MITKITSSVQFSGDEDALVEATATIGPISIAMDASSISYYESGIFSDEKYTTWYLNHGVLIGAKMDILEFAVVLTNVGLSKTTIMPSLTK